MKKLFLASSTRLSAKLILAWLPLFLLGPILADVKTKSDDKKNKNDIVIPEAREITKNFVAGQTAEVELVAAVGSLRQVTFIIREAPQHGTLSVVRPNLKEGNKAVVTYTHRDTNVLIDRFTYACRVEDGPVSAPATVSLIGQVLEPKLELLDAPSIGKVFLGGEDSGVVTIKNNGVATFDSELKWESPWSGPAKLLVKPGETEKFTLTFRPTRPGDFRMERLLQVGQQSSKLVAFGECLRALSVTPSNLTLTFNPKNGTREGVLSLFNNKSDSLRVNLKLPSRLKTIEILELQPKAKQDIALSIPEKDVDAFTGQMELLTEGEAQTVTLNATATPGELKLINPENGILDLGSVESGVEAGGFFIIKNIGGSPLLVEADALTPFSLETKGSVFRLETNEQKQVRVMLKSERSGDHIDEIKIQGNGKRVVVKAKAVVLASKKKMEPDIMPMVPLLPGAVMASETTEQPNSDRPPSTTQMTIQAILAQNGIPIPREFVNPYLDTVQSVEMLDRTATSVSLAWKKPSTLPAGWRMEVAGYFMDPQTKTATKVWQPINSLKAIDAGADKMGVLIEKMTPASRYEMRVFAFDREGKVSEPSPVFSVSTAAAWKIPSWFWRGLVFVVLSAALYTLYRVRLNDSM